MDSAQTVMTVHYLLKAVACEIKKKKKKKGWGAGETQMWNAAQRGSKHILSLKVVFNFKNPLKHLRQFQL